jgi:hypothetical protein
MSLFFYACMIYSVGLMLRVERVWHDLADLSGPFVFSLSESFPLSDSFLIPFVPSIIPYPC